MKKTFTLLSLMLLFGGALRAQFQAKTFHDERPVNMALVLASRPTTAAGFSSISEARSIITDIMNVTPQQQNFEVISTTQVDNAAALFYQGKRYILYNPSFINKLDNTANDRWASISVLAHEIGHHVLGHTMDGRGSQLPKELASDEFSGAVLRKMGASLSQAQLAMQIISSPYASATHPGQKDRLDAISKGWNTSSYQERRNDDVAIDYPPVDNGRYPQRYPERQYPNTQGYPQYPDQRGGSRDYPSQQDRYPSQQDRYPSQGRNYPNQRDRRGGMNQQTIVYDIRFTRSNGQLYYITSGNNVVVENRGRLQLVAKIAASNNPSFPYVIYDDQVQLRIDRRGNILNEYGRSIGVITRHV